MLSALLALCSDKRYRKKQRCVKQAISLRGDTAVREQAQNGHGFMPVADRSLKVTIIKKKQLKIHYN